MPVSNIYAPGLLVTPLFALCVKHICMQTYILLELQNDMSEKRKAQLLLRQLSSMSRVEMNFWTREHRTMSSMLTAKI